MLEPWYMPSWIDCETTPSSRAAVISRVVSEKGMSPTSVSEIPIVSTSSSLEKYVLRIRSASLTRSSIEASDGSPPGEGTNPYPKTPPIPVERSASTEASACAGVWMLCE